MELGERYYQLSLLGRHTFLDSVAQGALVAYHPRRLARGTEPGQAPVQEAPVQVSAEPKFSTLQEDAFSLQRGDPTEPVVSSFGIRRDYEESSLREANRSARLEFFPLCKKSGTPFVDLITLGRTSNNDITISDISVSRFQAFFRRRVGRWFLCDAGSKNGTRVDGEALQARTEREVIANSKVRFGSVELVFHTADSLFDLLLMNSDSLV